jgi:hypothetical protein
MGKLQRKKTHTKKLLLILIFSVILLFPIVKICLFTTSITKETISFTANNIKITTKWSEETNISNVDEYSADTPSSVIDSKNNIHIVWKESGKNRDSEIYYRMYINQKKTWTEIQAISNLTDDENSYYPVIKIDDKDNLHVIWRVGGSSDQLYYRNAIEGAWSEILSVTNCNQLVFSHDLTPTTDRHVVFLWGNDYDIYYKIYSLETKDWSDEIQLTNSTQHALWPSVDSDKNSNVYLTWSGGCDEFDKVEIFHQYLSRENWTLYEKMVVSQIDEIHSEKPKIIIDQKGNINIIWRDWGDEIISYYGVIKNNNLMNQTRLNNEENAHYTDIFIDHKNNKHFVWLDGYYYRYRVKTDIGLWSEEIIVKELREEDFTIWMNVIVNSKNSIKIFYTRWNNDSWELYYIRGKISYNFETLVFLSLIAVSISIALVAVLIINPIKKKIKSK